MASSSSESLIIRPAQREDCAEIFRLLKEFTSEFNQPPSRLSPEELEEDGFCSNPPSFQCLVVAEGPRLCGYTMFYPMYSAREGKALWLEDIFVSAPYRGLALGRRLFMAVVQEARRGGVRRIDFSVYAWNPAVAFYSKLGAANISEMDKWNLWRLDFTAIQALTRE